MPFKFEPTFTRQAAPEPSVVGLVIPPGSNLSESLAPGVREAISAMAGQSVDGVHLAFHYVPWPLKESLLEDGAEVDTGVYTFSVKDAVVEVFRLVEFGNDEFCWSFGSNAQRDVLAALEIGQTFDVSLEHPLAEAYHILRYHFPSGVADSGYGEYAVHLANEPPRPDGFRVVTSYEPSSARTSSRLPFFFGFRVFGASPSAPKLPVWRELLGHAVREAARKRWSSSLLFVAFSVEAFIDALMASRLRKAEVGDRYIDHVLRVADRREELHALNEKTGQFTSSSVSKQSQRLNEHIFTPRNRLAHGRSSGADATAQEVVAAMKQAVSFMWDWDPSSRAMLVTPMRPNSFQAMIDDEIRDACR